MNLDDRFDAALVGVERHLRGRYEQHFATKFNFNDAASAAHLDGQLSESELADLRALWQVRNVVSHQRFDGQRPSPRPQPGSCSPRRCWSDSRGSCRASMSSQASVVDLLSWAILNNSRAWLHHHPDADRAPAPALVPPARTASLQREAVAAEPPASEVSAAESPRSNRSDRRWWHLHHLIAWLRALLRP